MNSVIMRKIAVTASYQPLATGKLVASVTILAPPSNTATVSFKGDDGTDVPWAPGQWHYFKSIDLGQIQIKGTVGNQVIIVGGTW
jgi:hypothetical protein